MAGQSNLRVLASYWQNCKAIAKTALLRTPLRPSNRIVCYRRFAGCNARLPCGPAFGAAPGTHRR
jgi:hypothetical protein